MNTAKEEIANESRNKQNGYEQQHRNNFLRDKSSSLNDSTDSINRE
jgi:hypothetical protein